MFAPAAISKASSRCYYLNLLLDSKQLGAVLTRLFVYVVTLGFQQGAWNTRLAVKGHDMLPTFQDLLFSCALIELAVRLMGACTRNTLKLRS